MEIPQTFTVETDAAAAALFEQQQRELDRHQTRYVYLPFQDGLCPQIPGGYVPAGAIHPVPAPKGKINVKALPDGAQVLQIVSPSLGVPDVAVRTQHKDPEMQRLYDEIEKLKQMAVSRGQEPPSIAIYLHEVKPIVDSVTSLYAREGGIEVMGLFGMPEKVFEKYRINDFLFGLEGERPTTAKGILAQLREATKKIQAQKGEAGRVLNQAVGEIRKAVERCEQFCAEHVRQRHLEMDDPQNDAPKRYSRRDLRAIDFASITKRNEYLQRQAEQQEQATKAIPEMLEVMARREQQWAQMFGQMTETLKTIAANQKK